MKYPRFSVKISNKKGEMVHEYHSKYKTRFLYRLDLYYKRGFHVYIKVTYGQGFHNEGEYTTKRDAIYAFRCFTNRGLINDFKGR